MHFKLQLKMHLKNANKNACKNAHKKWSPHRVRPLFSLSVRGVKQTEPLILTVRFLAFDRTKMYTVTSLLLRTANRTASKLAPLTIYI